jgi:hypothetical protein
MQRIYELTDNMFETKLGPMIEAQVKINCPKDTGALADSVSMSVDRVTHALYVQAYGDESRPEGRKYYAAYVDLGHHQIAWGHDTGKVKAPTAFMRRALYRRYAGF